MCFRVTSPLLLAPEACTPRLPTMTKAMINMELVRRRTWIFFDIRNRPLFLLYKTGERLQGELLLHYSYLSWMQLSFPRSRKILSYCPCCRSSHSKEWPVCNLLRLWFA